jgi:hypothetical protein
MVLMMIVIRKMSLMLSFDSLDIINTGIVNTNTSIVILALQLA